MPTGYPSFRFDASCRVTMSMELVMNRTDASHRAKLAPLEWPLPKFVRRALTPVVEDFELIGQAVSPRLSCPEFQLDHAHPRVSSSSCDDTYVGSRLNRSPASSVLLVPS